MVNAKWNEKFIIATEIAQRYENEKKIRIASAKKELRCLDSECTHPVLRYCHGDKKNAFFAHLNNSNCDYAEFDRNDTFNKKMIRQMLHNHFVHLGYNVKSEIKVLEHHYTHLLLELNTEKIAVELGTKQTTVNQIEMLNREYNDVGIAVNWVVIDDTSKYVLENQTFFLKRFVLHESKSKSLVVIDDNGMSVAQYIVDRSEYNIENRNITFLSYGDTYQEKASIRELDLVNGELSIKGFEERYNKWLAGKRAASCAEKKNKPIRMNLIEKNVTKSTLGMNKDGPEYHRLKNEILDCIGQQEVQARDSSGNRWVKCEVCGDVDTENRFGSYGGLNHINLGKCKNCLNRKN